MDQLFKRTIKIFFYILLVAIISSSGIAGDFLAQNQEELILVNDIHPGMKGVGKTVFSGTKIEEFEVEVIDIIQGSGVNYPYILVKLSGEKIDNNGGISAGMSGSPVYFKGKLAGAISHAWEMSQHNLCLITPIHIMLTLLDYTGQKEHGLADNSPKNDDIICCFVDDNLKERLLSSVSLFPESNDCSISNFRPSIDFYKIQSPLLISGFKGRAGGFVKNYFKESGVVLLQDLAEYPDIGKELEIGTGIQKIEPGSAIGVQLSLGDVSVMGIGTATYCQNNYVVSFGHPFLHHGSVSYLFTAVYIYHSFPNIVMPFKIGSPYLLLGEVIQDRNAGILARMNKFPSVVSCKINVHDLDRHIKENNGTKIVTQKEIIQAIVPGLLIQSIDNALDRIGPGTAIIKFSLRNANNGEIIYYDNIYFSEDDIAVAAGNDFNTLLNLLYYNYYEKIDLNEIIVDVDIKEQNQNAFIKEVKLDNKVYYPGENIEPQITVAPFRLADEQRTACIKVPDGVSAGNAVLIVRGGLSKEQTIEKNISQDSQDYLLEGWTGIETYLKEKDKNNQIIVELFLFNENEESEQTGGNKKGLKQEELKVTLDTDFAIEGYHEIFLNVKTKDLEETK